MWRRGRDRGAMSVQQFSNDLLPLILLFGISVTGLFLTASTHLMRGLYYVFLSQLHAVTVIFTLLYLPFGKFFHIFQRPAQMGIDFYKRAGEEGEQALCARCGKVLLATCRVGDSEAVQARSAFNIRWKTARTTRMFVRNAGARISRSRKMPCGNPRSGCASDWKAFDLWQNSPLTYRN
jgi:hypothetical protein